MPGVLALGNHVPCSLSGEQGQSQEQRLCGQGEPPLSVQAEPPSPWYEEESNAWPKTRSCSWNNDSYIPGDIWGDGWCWNSCFALCLEGVLCKPTGKLLCKNHRLSCANSLALYKAVRAQSVQNSPGQCNPNPTSVRFLHASHKQRSLSIASHPLRSLKHWCQTSIHMLVRFVPAQHSRVFPGEKNEFKLQSVSIYEQEGVTFAPFSEAV